MLAIKQGCVGGPERSRRMLRGRRRRWSSRSSSASLGGDVVWEATPTSATRSRASVAGPRRGLAPGRCCRACSTPITTASTSTPASSPRKKRERWRDRPLAAGPRRRDRRRGRLAAGADLERRRSERAWGACRPSVVAGRRPAEPTLARGLQPRGGQLRARPILRMTTPQGPRRRLDRRASEPGYPDRAQLAAARRRAAGRLRRPRDRRARAAAPLPRALDDAQRCRSGSTSG